MVEQTIAEKLEYLFEKVRKPDGSPYTQSEVIEGTKGVLTRVYLWKLRTGRAQNPGYQIIQAISEFFDVDPSYFFEGDKPLPEKPAPEGKYLEEIATRSSMLDEKGREAILGMIDYILKSQKKGPDDTEGK